MWEQSSVGAIIGVAEVWSGVMALLEARKEITEERHVGSGCRM